MVLPDTHAGCLDIKTVRETISMSQFEHDILIGNLNIAEWMNEISVAEETYSEFLSQNFNLYSTLSCPLFKDYMDTRRSEWE